MSTATISRPVSIPAPARSLPVALLVRWHLFSLDAPCVAMVWLLLLNRYAARSERFVEAAALGLAVWCIYVTDRLLDAHRLQGELRGSHYFHNLNRRTFLVGLAFAVPLMLVLVEALPHSVRTEWIILAAPLALYAVFVHLLRLQKVLKEKFVGAFFAMTVALPAWKTSPNAHLLILQAGFFGLLCWLNCVAIARWERPAFAIGTSPYGSERLRLLLGLFIASSLIFTLVSGSMAVGLPLILAGLLLLLLHVFRRKFDPLLLRSMADATLLTPLLVLPFLCRPW